MSRLVIGVAGDLFFAGLFPAFPLGTACTTVNIDNSPPNTIKTCATLNNLSCGKLVRASRDSVPAEPPKLRALLNPRYPHLSMQRYTTVPRLCCGSSRPKTLTQKESTRQTDLCGKLGSLRTVNPFETGIDDALPAILQRDGAAFLSVSGVRCPGLHDTPRALLRHSKA